MYKRAELDERFIERVLQAKISDQCIFSMARMPENPGKLVVDANKRATIINESNFEVVGELDPSDSQMVAVGF